MAYEEGLLDTIWNNASKAVGGMLGSASNTQPTQEEIENLRKAYAQRAGVMDTPDPIQRESRHYYDQYTPSTFGHKVDMVHGSHPIWNEFGDRTLSTFEKYGLKVDRKNLFPWDATLSSSADRNIPRGTHQWLKNPKSPHQDYVPWDLYEKEWLEQHTDMPWFLNEFGRLKSSGKYRPDINHLAVTQWGADDSRDWFGLINKSTGEQQIHPSYQNVTGHEYGHYLDKNLGGEHGFLSDVIESMVVAGHNPHNTSQEDLFNLWMNDPRTAHLDVEDRVNQQTPFYQNNPRKILGHLYTSALMEGMEGEYPGGSMIESVARALGTFMDDQALDEGHSQAIMDQRRSVMGALANILGQKRKMIQ